MKKKILLALTLIAVFACLFVVGVSAAEFGTVTTIPDYATVDGLDTTSRVLMDDGITYPSAYLFKNLRETDFVKFSSAVGKEYTAANVVMLEYPEGCTYVDGAFSKSKTIEYVYFSSTITGFRWEAFGVCSKLTEVEFAENSTVEAINNDAFHDTAIVTLKLPNSLKTIGENFIRNCKSLTTIYFGANFTQVFNRNALLAGCSNIKTIYMPTGVFDENGDIALNHKFFGWNDRDNTKFVNGGVIYYTGTMAQARKIIDTEKALYQSNYSSESDYNTAVWWVINLVSLEEYNKLTNEQKSSGCYMVYGYSQCDAFYNGEHGNTVTTYGFAGADYFTAYQSSTGCNRCTDKDVVDIANALFTYKGFSTDGNSIVYDIRINKDAIKAYNNATGKEIKYGIVASQIFNDGALLDNDGTIVDNRVVSAEFSGSEYSILQIKILNVAEDLKTTPIHCCAYIVDGSKVKYLYDTKDAEGKAVPNAFDVANQVTYAHANGQ